MASPPGAAGPGAGYPQWTVNTTGWVVAEVVNTQEKALAIASTFPSRLVFFTSRQAAEAWARSRGGTPVTAPAAALGGQAALNAGAAAAGGAWNAATAVPRFLSMLTSGNLWLRIGEVAAGLILLGIGVNALFKGRPMSAVTGAAGKIAPLAMA